MMHLKSQVNKAIIVLPGNAYPPVANVMQEMMTKLGWEILLYMVYSTDLSPSNLFTLYNTFYLVSISNQKFIEEFIKSKTVYGMEHIRS